MMTKQVRRPINTRSEVPFLRSNEEMNYKWENQTKLCLIITNSQEHYIYKEK